jgi:sec-independent protein translocase protein TatA
VPLLCGSDPDEKRCEMTLGTTAMIGLPGGGEWMILFVLVLLLFGGSKIPELLRGVGKGMGELQRGLEEGKRKLNEAIHDDEHR